MYNQIDKLRIMSKKNEFQMIVDRFTVQEWKKLPNYAAKFLNIKLYKLQQISQKKIKQSYQIIIQKFYQTFKFKQEWLQNELRIFILLLICHSKNIEKSFDLFTQQQWDYLSSFFMGKSSKICHFQYLSLKKKDEINFEKWPTKMDELLKNIILKLNDFKKWNKIAKQLFIQSNQQFFKNAKQCRQRWNNYLDPEKFRGQWKIQQDFYLINFVINSGKKWAQIGKQLQLKRTQHMVKNRYKTLLGKQNKKLVDKKKKKLPENELLNRIYIRLKSLTQISTKTLQEQNVDQQEILVTIKKHKLPETAKYQNYEQQYELKNYEIYQSEQIQQIHNNSCFNQSKLIEQVSQNLIVPNYEQNFEKYDTYRSTYEEDNQIFKKSENNQFVAYKFINESEQQYNMFGF